MLEKCALLLESFPGGGSLTLADVCARTGLARSTAHRLLVELVELGWLSRTGSTFELGMPLFEIGERVAVKHRLRAAAMPFMQDLFAVTEQTIHLAVRDKLDVVYIEKLHGHTTMSLPSQIGGRLPLTCTGVGKALLAFESKETREGVLAHPLRRYTSESIMDVNVLDRQLAEIRRTGVSIEREEAAIGVSCVACPIVLGGSPTAAISVSVPTPEFRPELLAPAVRTATRSLTRLLTRDSATGVVTGTSVRPS